MRRTRVKICGITNVEDALAAVDAGADAIGLVFADSPRRIEPSAAREIVEALPLFVTTVGVFVNAPLDELHRVVSQSGVNIAQLHGEEPPDYVSKVQQRVLKRIRVTPDDELMAVIERVECYGILDILFDPGAGSGMQLNLGLVPFGPGDVQRVYLAGGLTPVNVSDVIRRRRPFAVDVSSGVEDSPGKKNVGKMRAFVEAVQRVDAEN